MGPNRPLSARLGRHFVACAALTAAAAANHADAEVIRWDINRVVPASFDGLYVKMDTQQSISTAGSGLPGWDINPYGTTALNFFASSTAPNPTTTYVRTQASGGPSRLLEGAEIGPTSTFANSTTAVVTGTTGANGWQVNAVNYFGFRFHNNTTNAINYGYGAMQVGANGGTRTLLYVEYENTGASITIGPAGPYDPCASGNPTLSAGAQAVAYRSDDTVADLATGCGSVVRANYYKFVPAADGEHFFSTCAVGAATRMAILDGCSAGASVLACSDNDCGPSATLRQVLAAGATYYVAIGADSPADALPSTLNLQVFAPYDPCAAGNPSLAIGANTVAANPETSASLAMGACGTSYRTNYYKLVAPITGAYTIIGCLNSAALKLAVMDGCGAGANQLACNDNACSDGANPLLSDVQLAGGSTYYVAVGSDSPEIPLPSSLSIEVAGPPVPTCETAPALLFGTNTFGNVSYAPNQVVTINAAGTSTSIIHRAAWYKFTPAVTGLYEFSTCGSVNDTKMALGTVCPSGNFTSLAYNDDSCACSSGCGGTPGTAAFSSRLFPTNSGLPLNGELIAGQTYYLVIGGYGPTTASVSGNLVITGPPQPSCPADLNDDDVVNGDDLGILLGQWGPCPTPCSADLNDDGVVNGDDLGELLGAWGACP